MMFFRNTEPTATESNVKVCQNGLSQESESDVHRVKCVHLSCGRQERDLFSLQLGAVLLLKV